MSVGMRKQWDECEFNVSWKMGLHLLALCGRKGRGGYHKVHEQ